MVEKEIYVPPADRKLRFSWKNHPELENEVAAAGKKYYEEAAKITGKNRSQKLFTAVTKANVGLSIDPELLAFVEAYKTLDALKEKCCTEENLAISLVSLTTLSEVDTRPEEREIREKNLARSIKSAKKYGRFDY